MRNARKRRLKRALRKFAIKPLTPARPWATIKRKP